MEEAPPEDGRRGKDKENLRRTNEIKFFFARNCQTIFKILYILSQIYPTGGRQTIRRSPLPELHLEQDDHVGDDESGDGGARRPVQVEDVHRPQRALDLEVADEQPEVVELLRREGLELGPLPAENPAADGAEALREPLSDLLEGEQLRDEEGAEDEVDARHAGDRVIELGEEHHRVALEEDAEGEDDQGEEALVGDEPAEHHVGEAGQFREGESESENRVDFFGLSISQILKKTILTLYLHKINNLSDDLTLLLSS